MTQKFIESAANEAGWNVKIKENTNGDKKWFLNFTTDTSLGQDVYYEFEIDRLEEIIDKIQETYEGYDPEAEAMLWYGKNGCPYTLIQLIDDMKEVDKSLYDLTLTINGYHLPDPINNPDFASKADELKRECEMHLLSISHRAKPSKHHSSSTSFTIPTEDCKYEEIVYLNSKWQLVDHDGLLYDIESIPLQSFCVLVDLIAKNTKPC